MAEVYGVDASPSFINSVIKDYSSDGKAKFKLLDCRYLENDKEAVSGRWDKVLSNAALHWILRDENTRTNTLKACYNALRPGGKFVFEMGGAGNVGEMHAALLSALMYHGLTPKQARDADAWFFPSEKWMRATLEDIGFRIEKLELEYRSTKCTDEKNGGLEGLIRLLGGPMISSLGNKAKEEAIIREVCEVLDTVVTRVEDGGKYLGFVRLRGVAVKPDN